MNARVIDQLSPEPHLYYDINKCKKSDQACSVLSQALDSSDIDAVKYVCSKLGIDYIELLYSNISSYPISIRKAKIFNDLEGAKYVLEKFNKTYPADLYNTYSKIEQVDIAAALLDLAGIKYIYANHNDDYNQFYTDAEFTNLKETIRFAIRVSDLKGIEYLLQNRNLQTDEFLSLVKYSYYRGELDIAEYLIQNNLKLLSQLSRLVIVDTIVAGLIRSNHEFEYDSIKQHITKLDDLFLSEQQYKILISLVDSMFNTINIRAPSTSMVNTIYTDSKNSNYVDSLNITHNKNTHHTVFEVLIFTILTSNSNSKIEFFMPTVGTIPAFMPVKIDAVYKDNLLNMPLNWPHFYSTLVHELCHAMIHILFQNHGLPYHGHSHFYPPVEYVDAVNETISNIISHATKGKYNIYNKDVDDLLSLNYWHILSNKPEHITKNLFVKFFDDESFSIKQQEAKLEEAYQSLIKRYGWTEEFAFVLLRVFDYFRRDVQEQPTEFFVRVPELYAEGISDNIMQLFKPAINYWQKYISPLVKDLIKKHYNECLELLFTDTLDGCIIPVLTSNLQESLLKAASEKGCLNCVKEIYKYSEIANTTNIQAKSSAISIAASSLGPCVKYCKTIENTKDESCQYIKPIPGVQNYLLWKTGDILYKCIKLFVYINLFINI